MEMTYTSNFLNLILGLFFLSACGIHAPLSQKETHIQTQTTDSIPIAHTQFTIDRFDAIYIVSPHDEIFKLNKNHQVEFQYSNSRLGTMTSIDVTNPLTTICFYEDFQAIILLDRTLNPISEINLGDWGFNNVTATCSAGNQELWVYDASDMQLTQIAKDRSTPIRTFPINLHTDDSFVITKMLINQENIYCLSAKGNMYQISLIGESLQKILGEEQYVDFQFSGNRLLVLNKKGQIFYYQNPLDLKQLSYPLAQKKRWGFQNNQLILGDKKVIHF